MQFLRKILGLPTGSPKQKKKAEYHQKLETNHRRLFHTSSDLGASLAHLKRAYGHKSAAQHALDKYRRDLERDESLTENPHNDDELDDAIDKHAKKTEKHYNAYLNQVRKGKRSIHIAHPLTDPESLKHLHKYQRANQAYKTAQGMKQKRQGYGPVARALYAPYYQTKARSLEEPKPWSRDYNHGEWQDKNPPKIKKNIDKD
jgi:hypothetical protein